MNGRTLPNDGQYNTGRAGAGQHNSARRVNIVARASVAQVSDQKDFVTVVSGLPRSGTSMLMQMLGAGGMPLLTDALRAPDEDNPRGYFEFDEVRRTATNDHWVDDAVGMAVKVIHVLLPRLPPRHHYRVLFLHRDLGEVL